LVVRLGHKDVYPNLAVLWVAPTTLYAKSTGLNVARGIAMDVMRYLILPGEMTPEAMIDELAGKEPQGVMGLDLEEWQQSRAYSGQRGVVLDEASSLFTGLAKDYNIGMGEALLRLYDCDPLFTRQTTGRGRSTVRDAYWSFLGATTGWHLKRAEVEVLWHTGLWPRFLLLTPEGVEPWRAPSADREQVPRGVVDSLRRLTVSFLPERTVGETCEAISMEVDGEVLAGYGRYTRATMRDLLLPPSAVDRRLWGVYGRLGEQALKIAMLIAALEWQGPDEVRIPRIEMAHWRMALAIVEACRASAHRLPGLLESSASEERETKVLMLLKEVGGDGLRAREIYRTLHLRSTDVKMILMDLMEAGLVEEYKDGRAVAYRCAVEGVTVSQGQGQGCDVSASR